MDFVWILPTEGRGVRLMGASLWVLYVFNAQSKEDRDRTRTRSPSRPLQGLTWYQIAKLMRAEAEATQTRDGQSNPKGLQRIIKRVFAQIQTTPKKMTVI